MNWRGILVLLGAGFAVALLVPEADRGRLVARGVDRLLAERADGLFAVLETGTGSVGARFRVDGSDVASPALERALGARLAEAGLRWSPDPASADALIRLPAGSRIFWRVDVRLADGRRQSSPTFIVTVE